jgi:hypothetical protein
VLGFGIGDRSGSLGSNPIIFHHRNKPLFLVLVLDVLDDVELDVPRLAVPAFYAPDVDVLHDVTGLCLMSTCPRELSKVFPFLAAMSASPLPLPCVASTSL